MKKQKKAPSGTKHKAAKASTSKNQRRLALHYMETLVEVAREPFLILDEKLRVVSASPIFYKNFGVTPKETKDEFVYELGNGQWNILELKKLLEDILPKEKAVKNYEVTHVFEKIGKKTMLLNAGQIDTVQLIILAIEDITEKKNLEAKLADYARKLEATVAKRTKELASRVGELEALNKSMIGRELKMVELKKEIENLERLVRGGVVKKESGNGNRKNAQNPSEK